MSQVWHDEVALESVVNRASHILLVERADPPIRKEEIVIDLPTYDGGSCPPYSLSFFRFDVIEAIRAPAGFDATAVEVARSDWDSGMDTHISYYVDGISESPVVLSYESSGDTSASRVLVFASEGSRGLEFVVDGAIEGIEMLDQVRRLVAEGTDPEFDVYPADDDTEAELVALPEED